MSGSNPGRLFVVVLAAAAAILIYQVFIPPIVGLADQGDFVRTIGRFGYGPQHHGSLLYIYVEPKYVRDPSYRQIYWEQGNTEYLFVCTALLLNKLVSRDGLLDITVAGFVHVACFLAVFARLMWVTRSMRGRSLVWIGALVVLTDAGYAVYWNSWYAEPASCFFCLLLLAEAIEIAQTGDVDFRRMLRWSVWAILWVLAKPQNAPIGLLIGLFTFRLGAWTRSMRARVAAVAGGCAMFACAAFNIFAMPIYGRQANTYGVIFSGILGDSKDPAADLRALGLDPQLAKYKGSGAWTPVTYFPQMAASGVLARVNTFTVLGFYVTHPARMWRRMHELLPIATFLRRDWYGNFEPSSGLPPAAQSHAFTVWSWLHEQVLPRASKWIVFALAVCPLILAWRWRRAGEPLRRRLELLALLPVCCLTALFSAVYGDAFDVIKHMYLFNLLLDACLICGLVWVARSVQAAIARNPIGG